MRIANNKGLNAEPLPQSRYCYYKLFLQLFLPILTILNLCIAHLITSQNLQSQNRAIMQKKILAAALTISADTHTHNHFTALLEFVRRYLGLTVLLSCETVNSDLPL